MSKKLLYSCFNNWKGSIWLIADTHFNDEDLDKIRPFSADDLVKNINKKVSRKDTLIILGDVGDIEYVKKIKAGYKVLITGNHDKGVKNYLRVKANDMWYLFDEVYDGCLMIRDNIILSHEPVDFAYAFNIHGHDHNGSDFKKYVLKYYNADMSLEDMLPNYLKTIKNEKLKHLNICADWVGYSPVLLKDVINSGVLKIISNVHRVVIDRAKEHK